MFVRRALGARVRWAVFCAALLFLVLSAVALAASGGSDRVAQEVPDELSPDYSAAERRAL